MDFLAISNFPSAVEGHVESFQQCFCFCVGFRRRADDDVHAPVLIDFIEVDFWEHEVLFQAHGIVATTVERFADTPRKSRIRGIAIVIRRSRNSYMRSPRRVTFAPRGISSRTRKPAMDFLALVVTAF